MSIKYLNDAWDMPLNSAEKIVLLAIADCANNEGFAYPGYNTLVKKTGMGKATLSKAIKVLKGCGILKSNSHSEFGSGKKVNTYTISLRSELPISTDRELIEKIKELRKMNSAPISSHLELRKVQTANYISSDREHEPSYKPSVKQPSVKEHVQKTHRLAPNENEVETVKKEKFKRPVLEEVAAFCLEKALAMEPSEFFNYYESNGWVVGKAPMKNWKAACSGWALREKKFSKPQNNNNNRNAHGKQKGISAEDWLSTDF